MKIIDVINFYYANHEVIKIKVRCENGLDGSYREFTKQKAMNFLDGFYDREAVVVDFKTHELFCGEICFELEAPYLYIFYK